MAYDVERVRQSFPALKEGAAHFDGPGGSQGHGHSNTDPAHEAAESPERAAAESAADAAGVAPTTN